MALIGTIRDKYGWVLILLLGVALIGFILQDILQNKSNYSAGEANTIGTVGGKAIDRDKFELYQETVYGNSQGDPFQVRNSVWNYFVEDALVRKEADALGLGVTKDELMELQFGQNLSPIIQQRFGQGGQVNFQQLGEIKKAIESNQLNPEYRQYWAVQENEIVKDRLQSKLTAMVSKAVYTPAWQAEMAFREGNQKVDFTYVRVPFDKVANTDVQVTDADYQAYITKNAKKFYQAEPSRTIDYVVLDVVPTAGDTTDAYNSVAKLVEGLRTAANDSAFIVANSGRLEGTYLKKAELSASMADRYMTDPIGTVVGPYLDNGVYSIGKIVDRKTVPDSVRARHILIKPESVGGLPQAEAKIDSLKSLLDAKTATFEALAASFGQDATSSKGGDLDWFGSGAMVKEFNELAFYKAEQGKVYKVRTQFGWHLVEVTGKKFIKNESGVRLAVIDQRVVPSKSTQANFRNKAEDLARLCNTTEELKASAEKMGLKLETAPPAKENDANFGALANGQDAREIIRWAYEDGTKKGKVRKQIFILGDTNGGYFDSKYIVTALKDINPIGTPSLATIKPAIETAVLNEKKAAVLKSKIANGADLTTVAQQYQTSVDSARGANIMSPALPTAGMEPFVVGSAMNMTPGASKVIAGNSGVYLVSVATAPQPATPPSDMTMFRRQASSQIQSQVRSRLLAAMKKDVKVEDNRSRFF